MESGTPVSRTRVELMGHQYTLKGDLDSEYMKSLALYVDEKIRNLQKLMPGFDSTRLALLVSLNIADELFQAKAGRNALPDGVDEKTLRELGEKTQKMIELLEEGIIGEPLR